MPTIKFIEHDGTEHAVEAEAGQSVMQAATNALVPGIPADCGGACACATCHGYIAAEWLDKFPAMEDAENDMLDFADGRKDNSRLTCQLELDETMDGLVIRLPENQF